MKNPCKGCQSYLSHCVLYIQYHSKVFPNNNIFRDRFCPCKDCIVKVTCTDPKVDIYNISSSTKTCKKLKEALADHNEFIRKNNISHNSIKRRKRKK